MQDPLRIAIQSRRFNLGNRVTRTTAFHASFHSFSSWQIISKTCHCVFLLHQLLHWELLC